MSPGNREPGLGALATSVRQRFGCSSRTHRPHGHAEQEGGLRERLQRGTAQQEQVGGSAPNATHTLSPTGITLTHPLRSFFIVSPTDQQVHCWSWIKKHMPSDPHLHLEDVSWKYTGESTFVVFVYNNNNLLILVITPQ